MLNVWSHRRGLFRSCLALAAGIGAAFGIAGQAGAGEAGRVVFTAGAVAVAGRDAAVGGAVSEGDSVVTGADGYVYIKTVDEGFLILRPRSEARVVAYKVDAADPKATQIKLELKNGVARHVSGRAVQQAKQQFRFNTPVAAIGVRGTDFTVATDQNVSRVIVIAGGVVVRGFDSGCRPEGGGPCEGAASRELFANQPGLMLQIQRGATTPELLKASGLAPNVIAPPRADEPASGRPAPGAKTSTLPADHPLALESRKEPVLQQLVAPAALPAPAPGTPREVVWGRWAAIADLPPDEARMAMIRDGRFQPALFVGSYFLTHSVASDFVMPQTGARAAFTLSGGEAYLVNDLSNAALPAAIRNPRLEVDFAQRQFTTSLDLVTAGGGSVDIRAQGDVTQSGLLVSDIIRSNSTVRGALGGLKAEEAAYIFRRTLSTDLSAMGATRWTR